VDKELTGTRFDKNKPSVIDLLYKVFTETEIGREFIKDLKTFCDNEQPKQTTKNYNHLYKSPYLKTNLNAVEPYLADMEPGIRNVIRQSMFGAKVKGYGQRNWKGGMKWSRIIDPILRHVIKDFFLGRDFDPESGGPEVAGAAWGALAYLTYKEENLGLDNRKDYRV
jgi:Domain of unknown function (DUF5664)